jgi:hypothetical protein
VNTSLSPYRRRNHLARQIGKLLFSHEILEHWDDEAYRNRMFLREENLLRGVERRAVLEYLALRAGFGVCKFESMGDGEERDPI